MGAKPLDNWDFTVKNGHIKRLLDPDIQSPALEIIGANVDSNFIFSPANPKKSLEIKMDCVKKAFGTNYVETKRVQINANCRIK